MRSFLLAWNPDKTHWSEGEFDEDIRKIDTLGHADSGWSCGSRRDLPIGSEFYLIRLVRPPKGIIGSGVTTTEPELGPHWSAARARRGEQALFLGVRFQFLAKQPRVS